MTETLREIRYRVLFSVPTAVVLWLATALLLIKWLPSYEPNRFIVAAAVVGKILLVFIAAGSVWVLAMLLLIWTRPWIVDFQKKNASKTNHLRLAHPPTQGHLRWGVRSKQA